MNRNWNSKLQLTLLVANISWNQLFFHTFKVSSEQVTVMRSEKMKPKYMKEDVKKCFKQSSSKYFAKNTELHFYRSLIFKKVASWNPKTVRSSHWRCSVKIGVLKNFANFTGKYFCWSLFLIKLQFWGPSTKVLFCEICDIFMNNYFEEHL